MQINEIQLAISKDVIIQSEIKETISSVFIDSIIDYPLQKKVIANIYWSAIRKSLILWEGDGYDTVGNWTQEQANNRIIELL